MTLHERAFWTVWLIEYTHKCWENGCQIVVKIAVSEENLQTLPGR